MSTTSPQSPDDLHAKALARLEAFERTGMSVPWSEVRQFLLVRAAGKQNPPPKARKFKL